jgi:hypothetical protein
LIRPRAGDSATDLFLYTDEHAKEKELQRWDLIRTISEGGVVEMGLHSLTCQRNHFYKGVEFDQI